jgi:uncharacterized membrane protein
MERMVWQTEFKFKGATVPEETPQSGLSDSAASGLAYITFIPAIIFLATAPYNQKPLIRFHSWQSIFLCIASFAIQIVLTILGHLPFFGIIAGLLSVVVSLGFLVLWLIVMIKAFNGQLFKIPVIGDFAEKQANS